jgi:hypothetical protein
LRILSECVTRKEWWAKRDSCTLLPYVIVNIKFLTLQSSPLYECCTILESESPPHVQSGRYSDAVAKTEKWIASAARSLRPNDKIRPQHALRRPNLLKRAGIRFAYRRFGVTIDIPLLFFMHFTGTMDHWDLTLADGFAQDREVIPIQQRRRLQL